MADLTTMRNIGGEMARKLRAVGIGSREELLEAGAKEAFFRLKIRWPQVCLVHLYALEGAVRDVDFNALPQETKEDLKTFNDYLRNGGGGG
jgi:DNA transformation protein